MTNETDTMEKLVQYNSFLNKEIERLERLSGKASLEIRTMNLYVRVGYDRSRSQLYKLFPELEQRRTQ